MPINQSRIRLQVESFKNKLAQLECSVMSSSFSAPFPQCVLRHFIVNTKIAKVVCDKILSNTQNPDVPKQIAKLKYLITNLQKTTNELLLRSKPNELKGKNIAFNE